MPTKRFALEVGGPKRLAVSWGFRWKNFVVTLDDREVGRVADGVDGLARGPTFDLPTGQKLRVQLLAGELHLLLDGKSVPGSEVVPLPKWAYAFVGACLLIPIVTLGGAIPGGIGAGGAAACAMIAKKDSDSIGKRVGLCVGVTVLCWGAVVGFLAMVGGTKSP